MSGRVKFGIAGVVIGLVLLWILPWWWIGALIILGAIALPVGGYMMLDPSQRRRLRRVQQRRREVGR